MPEHTLVPAAPTRSSPDEGNELIGARSPRVGDSSPPRPAEGELGLDKPARAPTAAASVSLLPDVFPTHPGVTVSQGTEAALAAPPGTSGTFPWTMKPWRGFLTGTVVPKPTETQPARTPSESLRSMSTCRAAKVSVGRE